MQFNDIVIRNIESKTVPLSEYHGKVLLIVNTASKCGFTPQYAALEALNKEYASHGLQILAFPCNQFGHQEPADDSEIQSFCSLNFNVTFPVMAKINVNGPDASPLYKYLKRAAPGLFGTQAIKWNFTKFLVSKDRNTIKRYAPQTKPEDIKNDIRRMLLAE